MLYAFATECEMPTTLISGRLMPVRRDVKAGHGRALTVHGKPATPRATLSDERDVPDRVIDVVVDRLLEELTW